MNKIRQVLLELGWKMVVTNIVIMTLYGILIGKEL